MDNAPTYTNRSNIIAASILGASLVASSLIVTQQPASSTANSLATTPAKPPIAQESVKEQFQKQLIAAPTLQTFRHNGKKYTLADVNVERVAYHAKTDDFLVSYQLIWQPSTPSLRAYHRMASLTNDGYGHYYGSATTEAGKSVDVTIR